MNFYREWKRWFLRVEFGRVPEPNPFRQEDLIGTPDEKYLATSFVEDYYARNGHPFQDEAALQGHITTPAGAQDFTVVPQEGGGGWGVVDVTRAAYVPNPVNQRDEE